MDDQIFDMLGPGMPWVSGFPVRPVSEAEAEDSDFETPPWPPQRAHCQDNLGVLLHAFAMSEQERTTPSNAVAQAMGGGVLKVAQNNPSGM